MTTVNKLPFKVRRFIGRSGDEIVMLTRRSGAPYFYPNVYATSDYRNAGKSPNTIARVLRAIGMAITWAKTKDRNLDQDLSNGGFISIYDAESLASFLGRVAAEQAAMSEAVHRPLLHQGSNVLRLEAYRPAPSSLAGHQSAIVSDEDVGARIRWVAKYAEWHLERRLHFMDSAGESTSRLRESAGAAIQRLRGRAPPVSGFIDDDRALEAPDLDVIKRIDLMLQPGSAENPFRSKFVQSRNYLAWRMLLDTGARRHEVVSAKSGDFVYTNRRFEIKTSKTIPRTVAFREKTAAAFDSYIMNYWKNLPQNSDARKSGYLFCREDGKRVSLRAINRIFEVVRRHIEDQPQNITPHAMRRFWNYLFSQQIDQSPAKHRLSPEKEMAIRKRIMGWSSDATAQRYNRRHILEAGNKVTQAMMDRLDEPIDTKITDAE